MINAVVNMEKNKFVNYNPTLEGLVDQLIKEPNHNPRDTAFRLIVSHHSKAAHTSFNFPGKFVKKLDLDVHTENGRNLRMDHGELVLPDGIITRKSTINVEHQSTKLYREKIDRIYDYKLYLIHKHNIPSRSIVITNIDPGEKKICYEAFGETYQVDYILCDIGEIKKRLNILRNIINNNKPLSDVVLLNFAYIAIFVEDDVGKEIIEEIAQLFGQLEFLNNTLYLDLYQTLKKMIKYHFLDDLEKTKELLTMITKSVPKEIYGELSVFELFLNEIDEYRELVKQNEASLLKKDKEMSAMGDEMSTMRNELSAKDQLIEDLKKQLEQKNHKL